MGSDGLQVGRLLQRPLLDVLDGHHAGQQGVAQHGAQSHQRRQQLLPAFVGDVVEVGAVGLRRPLRTAAVCRIKTEAKANIYLISSKRSSNTPSGFYFEGAHLDRLGGSRAAGCWSRSLSGSPGSSGAAAASRWAVYTSGPAPGGRTRTHRETTACRSQRKPEHLVLQIWTRRTGDMLTQQVSEEQI